MLSVGHQHWSSEKTPHDVHQIHLDVGHFGHPKCVLELMINGELIMIMVNDGRVNNDTVHNDG